MKLFFDFETVGRVSIKESMPDYVFEDKTKILCCAINDQVYTDHGEILDVLLNGKVTELWAHNAQFDMLCLIRLIYENFKLSEWRPTVLELISKARCSLVYARACGLPGSLDVLVQKLKLCTAKDSVGNTLIEVMNKKHKNYKDDPAYQIITYDEDALPIIKRYCLKDVEVMRKATEKMETILTLPADFWKDYAIDFLTNHIGIDYDTELARKGCEFFAKDLKRRNKEVEKLSNGEIKLINSHSQYKNFLVKKGYPVQNVDKKVLGFLKTGDPAVAKIIDLRLGYSVPIKTKYLKAQKGHDTFLLNYLGAHTSRSSSHGFNLLNFNRSQKMKTGEAVEVLKKEEENLSVAEETQLYHEAVKGLIKPKKEGDVFAVFDLSQIEFRIGLLFSGADASYRELISGKDLYLWFAKKVFQKKLTKESPERYMGKQAMLTLLYLGGENALDKAFLKGGVKVGTPVLRQLVRGFNQFFPEFKSASKKLYRLVWETARYESEFMQPMRGIEKISYDKDVQGIRIKLESGSTQFYSDTRFYGSAIYFMHPVRNVLKELEATMPFENLCQRTARDVLSRGKMNIKEKISAVPLFHVYDELIYEVSKDFIDSEEAEENLKLFRRCIERGPFLSGKPDLKVKAEGYVSKYYGGHG